MEGGGGGRHTRTETAVACAYLQLLSLHHARPYNSAVFAAGILFARICLIFFLLSTTVSISRCSFVLMMILDDESEPAQPTFRWLRGNLTILFFSITIHAFLTLDIL